MADRDNPHRCTRYLCIGHRGRARGDQSRCGWRRGALTARLRLEVGEGVFDDLISVHSCAASHPLIRRGVRSDDLERVISECEMMLDSERWVMVSLEVSDDDGGGSDLPRRGQRQPDRFEHVPDPVPMTVLRHGFRCL